MIGVSLAGAFLGNLYGSWGERRFTHAGILYSEIEITTPGRFLT